MRPRRALLVLSALAGGAAVAGWQLWSEPQADDMARDRGAALAAALRAGAGATADIRAPHRCARLHAEELGPDVTAEPLDAPRAARGPGPILAWKPPHDTSLTIGVVADAHGAIDALPGIQRAFHRAGVDLVISLGGMGMEHDSIARALAALAAPDMADRDPAWPTWPVLAMPGDWEAMPAHRAAVAALADRGVIDGSAVRLLDMAAFQLATLPGAPHPGRLMTGSDGCVFTTEDATAITALLAERPGVRLLLVHAPPRQDPAGPMHATDTGHTGVPVGERALADALRATPVDAVIHGLVASHDHPGGEHPLGSDPPVILSAGSLDPLHGIARTAPDQAMNGAPRGPTALVARITRKRITWQQVTPEPH